MSYNCSKCKKDLNEDFLFCPYCGTNQKKPIKCPKCNHKNEYKAKFCQECAAKLNSQVSLSAKASESESIQEITPVPKVGITIEFPYSSSQNYDFAVEEAKKISTYKCFGSEKKVLHRVTLDEKKIEDSIELVEKLKGWRTRVVYVKGEKVQWDSVFNFVWCLNEKSNSFKPEYYCFGYEEEYLVNPWGCLRSNLTFSYHDSFLKYGKFINKKGDWELDKERVKHELEKNLYHFRFCPALNTDFIQDIINVLPDIINPKDDKNFDWITDYFDNSDNDSITMQIESKYDPGEIEKVKITGIEVKNKSEFIKDLFKKVGKKPPKLPI